MPTLVFCCQRDVIPPGVAIVVLPPSPKHATSRVLATVVVTAGATFVLVAWAETLTGDTWSTLP